MDAWLGGAAAVSYTHLDVYKRQVKSSLFLRQLNAFFKSGGFLRRYGSGCPVGCHPETALADDVRLFRRDCLVCRYAFSLIPVQ